MTRKTDLSLLLFLFTLSAIFGCNRPGAVQQQTVVYALVYEIDPDDSAAAKVSGIEAFREPAERRVRSEYNMRGEVRTTKGNRLHIGLYDKSPESLQSVKEGFRSRGDLELRILANFVDHPSWIERAKAADDDIVYDEGPDREGKPRAKWVRIISSEVANYSNPEKFATRRMPAGETELLVMSDPYNITSAHLKRVVPGFDSFEYPCVHFEMSQLGAELIGHMTSANLPDSSDNRRQLGIILDGHLYSAPMIQSTIYDRGQITGNFTFEETNNLAIVLGAGPLPARLRLVSEGAIDPNAKAEK